jgi:hypothetical protein
MPAGGSATRRAGWLGAFSVLACVPALLAVVGLVRSLLAMTYLNIHFADEVSPLSRAISYYVFVEHGAQTFVATLVAVVLATAAILLGMAQLGVRLGGAVVALFAAWCAALLLCAVFPTDNSPRVETVSGWIHQFAGASLYVTLPLGGLALAHNFRSQPGWAGLVAVVRGFSFGAAALGVAYLLARLPDLLPWITFPALLDGRVVAGLIQRALFTLEIIMLLVLSVRLLRLSWTASRPRRRGQAHERLPVTVR